MNVAPVYNTSQLALIRTARSAAAEEQQSPGDQSQDKLELSPEGRQAVSELEPRQSREPLGINWDSMSKEEFISAVRAQLEQQELEINWNAAVDPDGQIWCKTYFDSYVSQAVQFRDTAVGAIQDCYAGAYQEALHSPLGRDLPSQLNFIAGKYQCSWSDFFDASMPAAERQWTYTQVRAMLTGTGLRLNDPYALKDIHIPTVEETTKTAKQAADNKISQLISPVRETGG